MCRGEMRVSQLRPTCGTNWSASSLSLPAGPTAARHFVTHESFTSAHDLVFAPVRAETLTVVGYRRFLARLNSFLLPSP